MDCFKVKFAVRFEFGYLPLGYWVTVVAGGGVVLHPEIMGKRRDLTGFDAIKM